MQKQIIAFRAPGLEHFNGSALCKRGRGCIHVNDAVHDPAHLKQVIHRQENHGHQDQSGNGETVGHSSSQRISRRKNFERFADS